MRIVNVWFGLVFVGILIATGLAQRGVGQEASTSSLRAPKVLRIEHIHLQEELATAQAAGGRTGQAAMKVGRVMAPHFEEEDRYAMPPIGLLKPLAEGTASQEQMQAALAMSDQLKANYKKMLAEHQAIKQALGELAEAARAENKPEHAEFAERLILHAQNEEQVLYPATLVLGDYLRLKMKQPDQP